MNELRNLYVTCSCQHSEHTIRFSTDGEEMWVEVQLKQYRNFKQRLWVAIKYLFGYKCKYGHWDCTNINKKQANRLYYFLKHHKDKLI